MGSHSKQVLVVDDERINQIALKLLLESLGYEVTVANNGEEAVALFNEKPFLFVIMDFNMPQMDGLTAVQIIRGLEKGRDTFIMGLTAFQGGDPLNAGLIAGMDVVYYKPITVDMIEQTFGTRKKKPRSVMI